MAGWTSARSAVNTRRRDRSCETRSAALAWTLMLGLASAWATPSVSAHQLKEALTTVEVNAQTELVEVVHRFYVHDAEHVVGVLGGLTGDILTDETLRIAFARYVAGKFQLADADRTPLPLALIGIELDGAFLWVYQEMPADQFDDIAYIAQRSMHDVWRDQINQVNVKRADGVRSLYLRAGDGLRSVPVRDAANRIDQSS